MKTLQDLFEHQLQDLYSAESQMVEALPKMASQAKDKELKKAIENHLKETKDHKKRLEEISKMLGIKASGKKCKGMEGLIKEAEEALKENDKSDVLDAEMIAHAQRVEHYEISGYGTVVRYARELGHEDIADPERSSRLKDESLLLLRAS